MKTNVDDESQPGSARGVAMEKFYKLEPHLTRLFQVIVARIEAREYSLNITRDLKECLDICSKLVQQCETVADLKQILEYAIERLEVVRAKLGEANVYEAIEAAVAHGVSTIKSKMP